MTTGPHDRGSRRRVTPPPLPYWPLAGADLANLGTVRRLGAPVASIGGAGTFDGIFLAGITAVLLAGLL